MLISVFVVSLSADTTSVQNAKDKSAAVNEDLLIDDTDKDILNLSETVAAEKTVANTPKGDSLINSADKKTEESDEELILDGAEEDLLGAVKPEKPKDTVTQIPSVKDTSAGTVETAAQKTDSTKKETIVKEAAGPVLVQSKPDVVPVKIEATDSINFARNLKSYRNPKIAMLLSLILPGTGEAYARNGIRSAIFGAVEVGIIATAIGFNVRGNNQTDDAHAFADKHYSSSEFLKYFNTFKNSFDKSTGTSTMDTSYVDSIFLQYGDLPDKNFSSKSKDFYNLVSDEAGPYIQGWDDAVPELDENFNLTDTNFFRYPKDTTTGVPDSSYLIVSKADSTTIAFGFSKNRDSYEDKMKKANKQFKISQTVWTLLLVNHILSAIDAGICAKAYNDKLLGKQSMWQHINLKSIAVNSGSGIANGYALEVRF